MSEQIENIFEKLRNHQDRNLISPIKMAEYRDEIRERIAGLDEIGIKAEIVEIQARMQCIFDTQTIFMLKVNQKLRNFDDDVKELIKIFGNLSKKTEALNVRLEKRDKELREYIDMITKTAGNA